MECQVCKRDVAGDGIECISCDNKCHLLCTDVKTRQGKKTSYKCTECRAPESPDIFTMLKNIQIQVNKIDGITAQLEAMDNKFTLNYAQVTTRVDTLEKENSVMKLKLMNLEQRSRIDNVELSGVPASKNEDVFQIVIRLAEIIGFPLTAGDILFAHRVPTYVPDCPPNIVAHLRDRRLRADFIKKYKEYSKAKGNTSPGVKDLFPQMSNTSRVFLNEHLCPEMKKVLTKTKAIAKKEGYKYVWVDDGRVKVRKAQGGPALIIRTETDLSRLEARASTSRSSDRD